MYDVCEDLNFNFRRWNLPHSLLCLRKVVVTRFLQKIQAQVSIGIWIILSLNMLNDKKKSTTDHNYS